ncbi:MAG: hypothetical protein JWN64_284 [Parcubacteria group bacterium]|nr:hypothetical protein [Parcubacteria group bacterium]
MCKVVRIVVRTSHGIICTQEDPDGDYALITIPIRENETWEQAAVRGLKESTGLDIRGYKLKIIFPRNKPREHDKIICCEAVFEGADFIANINSTGTNGKVDEIEYGAFDSVMNFDKADRQFLARYRLLKPRRQETRRRRR